MTGLARARSVFFLTKAVARLESAQTGLAPSPVAFLGEFVLADHHFPVFVVFCDLAQHEMAHELTFSLWHGEDLLGEFAGLAITATSDARSLDVELGEGVSRPNMVWFEFDHLVKGSLGFVNSRQCAQPRVGIDRLEDAGAEVVVCRGVAWIERRCPFDQR